MCYSSNMSDDVAYWSQRFDDDAEVDALGIPDPIVLIGLILTVVLAVTGYVLLNW